MTLGAPTDGNVAGCSGAQSTGAHAYVANTRLCDAGGTNTASVTKLQIGLLGLARNLQKDLEGIATKADTNSPDGLHFVLQETVMSLLRNPEYCVYGYSTGMQGLNIDRTEDRSPSSYGRIPFLEPLNP